MATRNAELKLEKLQERHFGVTESLAAVLYESASLCLDRHFSSPEEFVVTADIAHVAPRSQAYTVEWTAPMVRQRDAWQAGEATEFGACCLALAAAEEHLQRVCRARAELGSGADYLLVPVGGGVEDDLELYLEDAVRLEVAGVSVCASEDELASHLRRKLRQTQSGTQAYVPAWAVVVGFNMKRIAFGEAQN